MTDEEVTKPRLSDEDAELIADKLWEKAKSELYLNAGKGVVNMVWKFIVMGFIALAIYGYVHGWWH